MPTNNMNRPHVDPAAAPNPAAVSNPSVPDIGSAEGSNWPSIRVTLAVPDASQAIALLSNAVGTEIARIKHGIDLAQGRLESFEAVYNVPSSVFAQQFTAEDLQGGDLEYVEWMGEYRLLQQLREDLILLQSLTYVTE